MDKGILNREILCFQGAMDLRSVYLFFAGFRCAEINGNDTKAEVKLSLKFKSLQHPAAMMQQFARLTE